MHGFVPNVEIILILFVSVFTLSLSSALIVRNGRAAASVLRLASCFRRLLRSVSFIHMYCDFLKDVLFTLMWTRFKVFTEPTIYSIASVLCFGFLAER